MPTNGYMIKNDWSGPTIWISVSNCSSNVTCLIKETPKPPKPWDDPDWVFQGIRDLKVWMAGKIRSIRSP